MATQSIRTAAEVPLTQLTDEQLRARVARAPLFLIHMEPRPDYSTRLNAALETAHLGYLQHLETQGRLYGAGPVGDPAAGRDMAIVAAASRAEAEAMAGNDPLHQAGLRANRVQGHTMNEGVACYVGRAMAQRAHNAAAVPAADTGAATDLEALRARAVGAPLQLVHLIPTDKPRPADDLQTGFDHFVWLRTHEMAARLMSCGPVEAVSPIAPGAWGGGLGVLAVSPREAADIAAAEPSGTAGYRRLTVEPWRMDYGLAAPIAKTLVRLARLP